MPVKSQYRLWFLSDSLIISLPLCNGVTLTSSSPTSLPPTTPAPAAPVAPETDITQPDLEKLNKGGNVTKMKELSKIFKNLNTDVDPADARTFYQMIIKLAEKRMGQISETPSDSE